MFISKCLSRKSAVSRGLATSALLLGLLPASSGAGGCEFVELDRDGPATPAVALQTTGMPWRARLDEVAGTVDIEHPPAPACRIELEDVHRVYGNQRIVVLRVMTVASDYLFFFDTRTCKRARNHVSLGVTPSPARERARLNAAGICTAEALGRKSGAAASAAGGAGS